MFNENIHLLCQYKNVLLFNFISGNIAEGVSAIPDLFLDQQPPILEITTHARTAEWNRLGVQLELNNVALAGCSDCTNMYQLWIQEKAKNATRKNLISALRAIEQNNVAYNYEEHLKTICL